ncbi:unnamed protein product [Tenebrio molitor]|nr:unnamed protein product [Tenebrio molitor]
MVYTNCKLTDMVLMYEKTDGNGREAQRLEKGEYRPRTNDRGRQRTARTLDAEPEI